MVKQDTQNSMGIYSGNCIFYQTKRLDRGSFGVINEDEIPF